MIYSANYCACTKDIVAYVFIALFWFVMLALPILWWSTSLTAIFHHLEKAMTDLFATCIGWSFRMDCKEEIKTTICTFVAWVSSEGIHQARLSCVSYQIWAYTALSLSHRPIRALLFVCEEHKCRQFHLGIIRSLDVYTTVKYFITCYSAFLMINLARDIIYTTLLRYLQRNAQFVLNYMPIILKLKSHRTAFPLEASTTIQTKFPGVLNFDLAGKQSNSLRSTSLTTSESQWIQGTFRALTSPI